MSLASRLSLPLCTYELLNIKLVVGGDFLTAKISTRKDGVVLPTCLLLAALDIAWISRCVVFANGAVEGLRTRGLRGVHGELQLEASYGNHTGVASRRV